MLMLEATVVGCGSDDGVDAVMVVVAVGLALVLVLVLVFGAVRCWHCCSCSR